MRQPAAFGGGDTKGQGLGRADLDAIKAADALGAGLGLDRIDGHRTNLGTFSTIDAGAFLVTQLEQGDLVEKAVDGSQGTKVFTEGAADEESRCQDE